MYLKNRLRKAALLFATVLLTASAHVSSAQDDKKKEPMPEGEPVLWRDPGDISSRDLFHGPGGEAMKPDLSRVTFMEEETGGYSPKFRVKDGAGRIWVAKMGKEAQPETASSRLAWAVGYVTETTYLAPCVRIEGAPAPKKEVDRCEGKGFANVRFEARPAEHKRLDNWGWKQNPFMGTREFQGLIVLMGLINNWDLKDTNNKVIYVPGAGGAKGELRYVISDLGATFGKTGNFITHNRNEPKDFAKSKFVERIEGERVSFAYAGKNTGLFEDITVENAKWVGGLLSRLSDQQLGDAFRAANFSPEEIQLLTQAVRKKISELNALSGPPVATADPSASPADPQASTVAAPAPAATPVPSPAPSTEPTPAPSPTPTPNSPGRK